MLQFFQKRRARYGYLILFIALCQSVGLLGSLFTMQEIASWYQTLVFPPIQPPSWIFGPVWTLLYTLMGIALWLLWKQPRSARRTSALRFFFLQLFLNGIWSPVFFGFHALGWAFVIIVCLVISVALLLFELAEVSKKSLWLLVPYFLWVMFATVLNGWIAVIQ